MGFSFSYRPLFSVDLPHEYYLAEESALYNGDAALQAAILGNQQRQYRIDRDLAIKPTAETAQILKDHNLLFKRQAGGFVVGAKVKQRLDETFVPFTVLDEPICLRFVLSVLNPQFVNFTNLRMERNPSKRDRFLYYFSNRAANVVSQAPDPDLLYLSRPIPSFDSEQDYEAGEVIIDSGSMLEALTDLPAAPSVVLSEWQERFNGVTPLPQFVTTADRTVLRPSFFDHDVTGAAAEILIAVVRDRENNIVWTKRYQSEESGVDLERVVIDLTDLKPGLHSLRFETTTGTPFVDLALSFYLDDVLSRAGPLALIEIFHEPDGSLGDYRLFDEADSDRLLEPSYLIRWQNRSTWWRYYLPADLTTLSSTQVEAFEVSPGNTLDHILVSLAPLGLTQVGRSINATIDGEARLLPNPGPGMIYPEDGRLFSEINLGGGLGPPVP
jgi:hypothetical protein